MRSPLLSSVEGVKGPFDTPGVAARKPIVFVATVPSSLPEPPLSGSKSCPPVFRRAEIFLSQIAPRLTAGADVLRTQQTAPWTPQLGG